MNLYEVTNSYVGESYVRVYVWAESEIHALSMAREKFKKAKMSTDRLEINILFSGDSKPFCSDVSDTGFND